MYYNYSITIARLRTQVHRNKFYLLPCTAIALWVIASQPASLHLEKKRRNNRMHHRKTILKGLHQAVEQNILEENKRPGTSNEYSFKPVEEWKPEPVRNKDTQKIGGDNLVQFPTETKEDIVETEPVQNMDYPETDTNTVVVINNLLKEEEQQLEVSIPDKDTPTIWRRNPDATRYCQIPPIYDQDTGVEIQRQMEQEGLTAQSVVGRALALTKVPLMLLELWANIGKALANSSLNVQSEPTVTPKEVLVSLQLSKTLEVICSDVCFFNT